MVIADYDGCIIKAGAAHTASGQCLHTGGSRDEESRSSCSLHFQAMTQQQMQAELSTMLRSAGPYPLEAFNFVREGLSYTVQRIHENADPMSQNDDRHITGQELCLGLRDYAIHQYGLLAPSVLAQWNIHRTDDFGRIVFAMVDAGLMSSTEEDSVEDFRSVYHFGEAFCREELLSHIGTS